MVDTRRLLADLQALLPDNVKGEISPQDARDVLVSTYPDVYNVKNYGAVGDGVVDDTAAIQAAFDAAGFVRGLVDIPLGDYKTTGKLTITEDIQVRGEGYGTRIIGTFSSANTDIIEVGPSGEHRVGVKITDLTLEFTNTNCRHGISIIANTSQFQCRDLDIRSLDSGAFKMTGACINFNGKGIGAGLNDWAEFKHCYLAFAVNGIVVDAANTINAHITQCTFTSMQGSGVKWILGGQSQISLNTFQNCNQTVATGALFLDGGAGSPVVGDIWVGPGNSFQNNGVVGAGSSEIYATRCPRIRIIGNQFQSVDATGAYRAIHLVTATDVSIVHNQFQAYDKGGTKGAVEVPTGSAASYFDNTVESGFEIADGTGLFHQFIGEISVKNAAGSEIHMLDPVTQVATFKAVNIDTQDIGLLQIGATSVQLSNGTITINNAKVLDNAKFFFTGASTAGHLRVSTITDETSFVVQSVDTNGDVLTGDQGYFYWMFIGT